MMALMITAPKTPRHRKGFAAPRKVTQQQQPADRVIDLAPEDQPGACPADRGKGVSTEALQPFGDPIRPIRQGVYPVGS